MATADVERLMAKKVRPKRYTYPMMAAALKVARRTLVRWVVAGQIPQPTTVGTSCFWEGRDLAVALSGPRLPGSFEYTPSSREKRRRSTARKNSRLKAGQQGNGSIRSRVRPGKGDQVEGEK